LRYFSMGCIRHPKGELIRGIGLSKGNLMILLYQKAK